MVKKNKLLLVLDMSEEEQIQWLISKGITDGSLATSQVTNKIVPHWLRIELADLAFRLRDEAVKENSKAFHDAIYKVMRKVEGHDNWATAFWGECIAKPIHWIIAALIAKEQK